MEKKTSKFRKHVKAWIRAFAKAKELYFKGVTECTGHVTIAGGVMGMPAPSSLPRSYSVSSDSSTRSSGAALNRSTSTRKSVDLDRKTPATVRRSRSVAAIGRIDENEAYDLDTTMKSEFQFPRSRSYAVSNRRYPIIV